MVIEINNEKSEDKIVAFATSDVFNRLFSDGMDLVEETAKYLDGEGRQESKKLERNIALQYASESMRLTTRLMQAASWLLVQRAVREGEMTSKDAKDPKYRIGARSICATSRVLEDGMPVKLVDLLDRSDKLYTRIDRLDNAMFVIENEIIENPVNAHMERLNAAFGRINLN